MTKKKETGVLASAKEETLNQIVKAQKEKIEALTAYGKKLKNQIKENKESLEASCQELFETFESEKLENERLHQKAVVAFIGIGILLGIFIGTLI
jgi:undecaprenyl pyrophosphate synthase